METNRPVIAGIGELLRDMLPTRKRAGKSFIPTPKVEVVDTVVFVCTKEGAWPAYPNQDRQ